MKLLDPRDESDRFEIAKQLFDRFCVDLAADPNMAVVRLISGIQVALRDAADGAKIYPPHERKP